MAELGKTMTEEARREELGRRYGGMVYRAAVRQMGGEGRGAEDVMQAVFLVAMRKAKSGGLPEDGRMAGWLLKVARYAVLEARRAAERRKRHEQGAAAGRGEVVEAEVEAEEVRGALDEGLLRLGAVDREVVVRRYLQGEAVVAVAAAVGMTENTAGRRIGRALEKLRKFLGRRGVVAPAAALAAVMMAEGAKGAPVGVIVGAGTAGGTSAAAVGIAKGAAAMMTWAMMKTAAVLMVGAMVLVGAGLVAAGQIGRAGGVVPSGAVGDAGASDPKAATRPVQTSWYLMGDEIFANKEAAEKVREARKVDPNWSRDLTLRDKAAELYSQAIDLQPGAAINAKLAERIAQMYAFNEDPARGIHTDGKKAAVWWKRAHEWAEPGTELWGATVFPNGSGGQDLDAAVTFYSEILDLDDSQVRCESWRLLDRSLPGVGKVVDGPLAQLPDPKASPSYEREMQRLRAASTERKRTAADRIVDSCLHSLQWPRGGDRTAEAFSVLKELSAKYGDTPVGERFNDGIAVLVAQAATTIGGNPALPPRDAPPKGPEPAADTYLGRAQAAANKALAADPPDLPGLTRSVAKALEVQWRYSPQPGETEPPNLRYSQPRPFGVPNGWAEELVADVRSRKSGKVSLVLAVPPEFREKRDRLLAEADAKIRTGLAKALTERLGRPENMPAWDRQSPSGRIAVAWGGRLSRYAVLTFVLPPIGRNLVSQMEVAPLFPNLGLVGHVGAYAQDPELDAALKQVLAEALAPLKELEAEAAKVERPEPPAPDPAEADRAAKERERMMRKSTAAGEPAAPADARPDREPASGPGQELDALAATLTKEVGGKWEVSEHNGFVSGTKIIRGRILSAAGKALVNYDVFPFGAQDARRAQVLEMYGKSGRILGTNDQFIVVEQARGDASEPSAKLVKLLTLNPPSAPASHPATQAGALDLDDAAKRLTEAAGGKWRVERRERAPGLGPELVGVFSTWYGMYVTYIVLPFPLDEAGQAKVKLYRQQNNVAPEVIASDNRCVVLAGRSREPESTAKILAALGLRETKESEQLRLAEAREAWLDLRLAVARPSDAKADRPEPLLNGPTTPQIEDYRKLFAQKGPNGGRQRGDAYQWFWRLDFCRASPLVEKISDRSAEYLLLSDRPEESLRCGSRRPRPWNLKAVYAAKDEHGKPAIGLEFDETAAAALDKLTRANVNRPLAVLFEDNVLAVVTIPGPISDKLVLSWDGLDQELVARIVRSLGECMLADASTVPASTRPVPATPPATH